MKALFTRFIQSRKQARRQKEGTQSTKLEEAEGQSNKNKPNKGDFIEYKIFNRQI